ncbi:MAG: radical SAM protein [Anaeromyxobacteraceae bacterium]
MARQEEFVPKWIAWEITRKCNLRCVHCRSSSDLTSAAGGFSTAEAFKFLDELAAYAKPVLVLSGGEPLLRPDVWEIAAHGTGLGLRMCLATNGLLVDDAACARMKQAGIRMVSLSLDGATAATHDDFRQAPGAFDATVRAARCLKANGIPFLVNSSFTKRNKEEIPRVYALAKELGAKAWYMFMIVPTGRGADIMNELLPTEAYNEVLDWHYETEMQEPEMMMRPTCAPHYYRIVLQKNKERAKEDRLERRSLSFSTGGGKGCIAAQTICLIDAFGNVQACSYMAASAGNVKQTPFKEIWEESALFKQLRDFDSYKGRCGACEYLNVCGGCRARAEAIHGDRLAEEPFCDYVPLRLRKDAPAP